MKRLLCLLVFSTLLLGSRAVRAQTPAPLGSIVSTLPINATKVLADPARDRFYALVTDSNLVVVVDTVTFQTTSVLVGSQPVDMVLSPDNNTLYTANIGSTVAAVSVVNLNTLRVSATFALPSEPMTIAAGTQGRVYALLALPPQTYNVPTTSGPLYQLDTATGSVQTPFSDSFQPPLQLGPDGTTLYAVNAGGRLQSFDVSTAVPLARATSITSYNGFPLAYVNSPLLISHNGQFVAAPAYGTSYPRAGTVTPVFSAADLSTFYGSFIDANTASLLAFSPDDSLAYQLRGSSNGVVIDEFSTGTFAQLQESGPFPYVPTANVYYSNSATPYISDIRSLAIDRTGSYLLLAGDFVTAQVKYGPNVTTGRALILGTGTGPRTAPSILPAITSGATAQGTVGVPFTFRVTATNQPTIYSTAGLPPGLTLDPATGLISGTPTTTSPYYTNGFTTTVSAANASGTITAYLSISIGAAPLPPPPELTSPSTITVTVGQPVSIQLTATNNPTNFTSGFLAPGLDLTTDGLIFGTPTTAGSYVNDLLGIENNGNYTLTNVTVIVLDPLPSVDVMAPVPRVIPLSGGAGEFLLQRTGDLSQPLFVSYTLSGNTHNGIDYRLLSGTVKIKAGRDSATIQVLPKGTRYSIPRTVRLTLQPADAYQLGGTTHARVTIEAVDPE